MGDIAAILEDNTDLQTFMTLIQGKDLLCFTCGQCVFWRKEVYYDAEAKDGEEYKNPQEVGICDRIKHEGDKHETMGLLDEMPGKVSAGVYDADSYAGGLITGINFGCLLHQKK